MLRYLNTDNGMVVEVPDWKAPKYDASCNMQRLEDSPVESPPPHGDRVGREDHQNSSAPETAQESWSVTNG